MKELERLHAEIYLSTVGAISFLNVGDFATATRLTRRAVVRYLESIPESKRQGQVHLLGIDLRTYYDWLAAVKEEMAKEGTREAEEDTTSEAETENVRFYLQVLGKLREAGERFLTVGVIADTLNDDLPRHRALSYTTVQQRLDVYAGLGLVERHPESSVKFRIAVRNPRLVKRDDAFRERVLRGILPALYRMTHQFLGGAESSGLKLEYYQVPEARAADFAQSAKEALLDCAKRLDALELQLQNENPSQSLVVVGIVHSIGQDILGGDTFRDPSLPFRAIGTGSADKTPESTLGTDGEEVTV